MAAKSQLELYLESLDNSANDFEQEIIAPQAIIAEQSLRHQSINRVTNFLLRVVETVLRGATKDAAWISGLFSLHAHNSPATNMENATRRITSVYFMLALLRVWKQLPATGSGVYLQRFLCRLWIALAVITVGIPLAVGALHAHQLNQISTAIRKSRQRTAQLISIIKRVQLVSMGGVLAHPLPPVSKLESKVIRLARSEGGYRDKEGAICASGHSAHPPHSHDDGLCARDMRNGLYLAMVSLLRSMSTATDSLGHNHQEHSTVPSLAALEEAQHSLFRSELPTMLRQLSTLPDHALPQFSSSADHKTPHSGWREVITLLSWYGRAVTAHVSTLWRLYTTNCALDSYLSRCKEICGPFDQLLAGPEVTTTGEGGGNASIDHCYADQYLALRKRVARMRSAYEQMTLQLYLAEAQLAQPELSGLGLLTDRAVAQSTGLTRSHQTKCLERTMNALCGAGTASSSGSVSLGDALSEMEAQLATLPTLNDYADLLQTLRELQEAIAEGQSPAQRLQTVGVPRVPSVVAPMERAGEGSSEPVMPYRVNPSQSDRKEFGDDSTDDTAHAKVTLSDILPSTNVIDVYTTVVPRVIPQDSGSKDRAAQSVNETATQSGATTVLRELRQHLRMLRSPPTSHSGDACSGAAAGAANSSSSAPVVRMERVRELVPVAVANSDKALQPGGGESVLVRVHPELVAAEVPISEEDVPPERGQTELIRIGTLLLTREEAAQMGLHSGSGGSGITNTTRAALASEMSNLAIRGGAGGSEFARALQARRTEASFGDSRDE